MQEREPSITIEQPTHLFDCTNSSDGAGRLQPTLDANRSADQAGFRRSCSTSDHFFTFQRKSLIEPSSGTSRCGSQPSTSKKPPTQWNTAAYGRLRGSTASRNHTYCYSQTNEHQCTLTVKANMSISSEEPSRETRFSTLLFNSLLQYIMKPLTGKWKRCNHGVRLAEDDPDTNQSNLRFADDILLISG